MSLPRHAITDEQWARVEPLISGKSGDPGATAKDNRRFVDSVVWILKTSAGWRDLPERFGKWNTQYQRFNRFAKKGRWSLIAAELGDFELDELQIDSTIIRVHQHGSGPKKVPRPRKPSVAREEAGQRIFMS